MNPSRPGHWAPESIAQVLGVDLDLIKAPYPSGILVEDLYQRSGKREHRPKQLLERIAHLKHREDSTDFRHAVADTTAVDALARACPNGFREFAKQLQEVFGSAS